MKSVFMFAAMLAFTADVAAQDLDGPTVLQPTSSWVLDFDTDSCALRRTFGTAPSSYIAEFRQYGPGNMLEITIVGDRLRTRAGDPKIRFEPDSESFEIERPVFGKFGERDGVIIRYSLYPNSAGEQPDWPDEEREAREKAVTGLLLADTFEEDLFFRTGAMRAPMNAMRTCMDDLVRHWGIDAEAQKTLSRPVVPAEMDEWARRIQAQYPRDMLEARKGGYVHIRLIVGPDGQPASCRVQLEGQPESFEQTACDTMMRYARFQPALDAGGQPIASYYVTTIIYSLAY